LFLHASSSWCDGDGHFMLGGRVQIELGHPWKQRQAQLARDRLDRRLRMTAN